MVESKNIIPRIRYYYNCLCFYGFTALISMVYIPLFMLRPCNELNSVIGARIVNRINWIISVNWKIHNREFLENDECCVIVANHQNSYDVVGMCLLWPHIRKCVTIIKKEIFYFWPFGLFLWLCGHIFIDRQNSDKARAEIQFHVERLKNQKIKLWFFPEGTRNKTSEFLEFKKGAFYIAVNNRLPILPVVFSKYYFVSDKRKLFYRGTMVLTILPPISTEGLSEKDIPELIRKTRESMIEVFKSSSREEELAL